MLKEPKKSGQTDMQKTSYVLQVRISHNIGPYGFFCVKRNPILYKKKMVPAVYGNCVRNRTMNVYAIDLFRLTPHPERNHKVDYLTNFIKILFNITINLT